MARIPNRLRHEQVRHKSQVLRRRSLQADGNPPRHPLRCSAIGDPSPGRPSRAGGGGRTSSNRVVADRRPGLRRPVIGDTMGVAAQSELSPGFPTGDGSIGSEAERTIPESKKLCRNVLPYS